MHIIFRLGSKKWCACKDVSGSLRGKRGADRYAGSFAGSSEKTKQNEVIVLFPHKNQNRAKMLFLSQPVLMFIIIVLLCTTK